MWHVRADGVYVTEYPGHTKMYEAVTQYCGFPAIEAGKLMYCLHMVKRMMNYHRSLMQLASGEIAN